jgi:hypothetical protein
MLLAKTHLEVVPCSWRASSGLRPNTEKRWKSDAMLNPSARRKRDRLTLGERYAACAAAGAVLVCAVWITVSPPDRTVALSGCENAAAGCLVNVDSDPTTFSAALAALAAAVGLIALLGVRFTSFKAAGVEFSVPDDGLPEAGPQQTLDKQDANVLYADLVSGLRALSPLERSQRSPLRVEVRPGLGTALGVVDVAIASLESTMNRHQAPYLRDYQTARRASQHGWSLVHTLGPARNSEQKYSVAIKLTPHPKHATSDVKAAQFYLGRAWGDGVFPGSRGIDGRFGITTEAYGPFLALCEVEFTTGERILLDHYCDFEMGAWVAASTASE